VTRLEVPRGDLRAAVAAVVPHAGRESEATPHLGRIRFHVAGDALLVWATDYGTTALAALWSPDFLEADAEGFDLAGCEAKKVLAVFRVPGGDGRYLWEQQPMRLTVSKRTVTFEETGDIVAGQSITLPRVQQLGEDEYPDVPRLLMEPLGQRRIPTTATHLDASVVNLPGLAKFAAAAKAYDPDNPCVRLIPDAPSGELLVSIGRNFVGMIRDYRLGTPAGEIDAAREMWARELEPLQRPPKPTVPDEVMAIAGTLRANGVTTVTIGDQEFQLGDESDDVEEGETDA